MLPIEISGWLCMIHGERGTLHICCKRKCDQCDNCLQIVREEGCKLLLFANNRKWYILLFGTLNDLERCIDSRHVGLLSRQ